jgi:hypothetical protein
MKNIIYAHWLYVSISSLLMSGVTSINEGYMTVDGLQLIQADKYAIVCEHFDSATLSCGTAEIQIVQAFYGVWSKETYDRCYKNGCYDTPFSFRLEQCQNNTVTGKEFVASVVSELIAACNNRTDCVIPAGLPADFTKRPLSWPLADFLGGIDPRPGVAKYLLVTYDCSFKPVPPPATTYPPARQPSLDTPGSAPYAAPPAKTETAPGPSPFPRPGPSQFNDVNDNAGPPPPREGWLAAVYKLDSTCLQRLEFLCPFNTKSLKPAEVTSWLQLHAWMKPMKPTSSTATSYVSGVEG